VQVSRNPRAAELLSELSESHRLHQSATTSLSHCHRCPLYDETLLKWFPSSLLCCGVLLTFPIRAGPTQATSRPLCHCPLTGTPSQPLMSCPPRCRPLSVQVRARKLAGPVHREPWMLMVNSCSWASHQFRPTGHVAPLASATHASPSAGSRAPVCLESQVECHCW
jgi:hypothetical protein